MASITMMFGAFTSAYIVKQAAGNWLEFTIPNEFVVGFGLDYNENYRNLPYVGVLKEEVYSN